MTEIAPLYGPVSEDIPRVGETLLGLAEGHHPLLGEALSYVFETGGKRIRPALVLLAGKLGHYDVERLVTLAASLEVVHAATLVHDDTIDQALTRRGLKSLNELWDSKVAILIGDFLFAQSAELAARLDSVRIMTLLSETVMAMSSGELRQYSSAQSHVVDEGDYFRRIAGKTASLFGMCCEGAGIVSGQGAAQIQALRTFGVNLGLAFQITDDVLDFYSDEQTLGKPAGNDLRQGTITLPVILMIETLPADDRLREYVTEGTHMETVIAAIQQSGALESALRRAEEYAAEARRSITLFPSCEAKDSLVGLTERVVRRTR